MINIGLFGALQLWRRKGHAKAPALLTWIGSSSGPPSAPFPSSFAPRDLEPLIPARKYQSSVLYQSYQGGVREGVGLSWYMGQKDSKKKTSSPRPDSSAKMITKELADAGKSPDGKGGDWRLVLALIDKYGSNFDHIHVPTAFVALKNAFASGSIKAGNLQEALASAQYKRFNVLLFEAVKDMDLRGISNVLNCLAHLTPDGGAIPCNPEIMDCMLRKVRAALIARDKSEEIASQSLSNTAWAIATMGIATDSAKEVMDSIAAVLRERRCWGGIPQNLSNIAVAYAKYQHRPKDAALADVLAEAATSVIRSGRSGNVSFTEQQLANLYWGIGSILADRPMSLPGSVKGLLRQLELNCLDFIPTLSTQGLSNMFLELTRLKYVSEGYLEAMCMEIVRRAGEDVARSDRNLSHSDVQYIANILWSCQDLHYVPPQVTIDILLGDVERCLTGGRKEGPSELIGVHLAQTCAFLAIVCSNKGQALPQGLIDALPDELIGMTSRMTTLARGSRREFDEKAACNALYSLTILAVVGGYQVSSETFSSLLEYLSRPQDLDIRSGAIEKRQQLVDTISALSRLGAGFILHDLLKPVSRIKLESYLAELQRFVERWAEGNEVRDGGVGAAVGGQASSTAFERDVEAALTGLLSALPGGPEAAGITMKRDFNLKGYTRAVDLYLERAPPVGSSAPPTRIGLEIDGPAHYFSNQTGSWGDLRLVPLADTLLRNMLLEDLGVTVVTVGFVMWIRLNKAKNPRMEKMLFVYSQLAAAEILGNPEGFFTPEERRALEARLGSLREHKQKGLSSEPSRTPCSAQRVDEGGRGRGPKEVPGGGGPRGARGGRSKDRGGGGGGGGDGKSEGGKRGRSTPSTPGAPPWGPVASEPAGRSGSVEGQPGQPGLPGQRPRRDPSTSAAGPGGSDDRDGQRAPRPQRAPATPESEAVRGQGGPPGRAVAIGRGCTAVHGPARGRGPDPDGADDGA